MKDYYKILGLTSNCTLNEIYKSFRILAKKYHPDKNRSSDTAEKFIEIFEAYEILRDPIRREEYDKLLIKKDVISNNFNDIRDKGKYYSRMSYDNFLSDVLKFIPNLIIKSSTNIFVWISAFILYLLVEILTYITQFLIWFWPIAFLIIVSQTSLMNYDNGRYTLLFLIIIYIPYYFFIRYQIKQIKVKYYPLNEFIAIRKFYLIKIFGKWI